jgi:FlaA1/EpsC-like NDP-sugar epimerase
MIRFYFEDLAGWFLSRKRSSKRVISWMTDFVLVCICLWAAFSLRLSVLYVPPVSQLWIFIAAPLIAIPIFVRFGLYRAIIRYIGVDAVWTIIKSVALFELVFAALILIAGPDLTAVVPRTVYGIHALLLLMTIGGSRFAVRWLAQQSDTQHWDKLKPEALKPPVLIYGAGSAGAQLASVLKMSHQMQPVGFLDDDKTLRKQQINGLVVYPPSKLLGLIEKYHVRDVLLAMPSVSRHRKREIIAELEQYPVHVRTLPDLMDLAEGKVQVSDIQEVHIADLLGREPVSPDQTLLHSNITGKNVLVSGAGGSIGSELCRQIITLAPSKLVLFEMNEFNLYAIEQELQQLNVDVPLIAVLGTVTEQSRLEALLNENAIHTIYHAAAYKHVPLVEKNIAEGVKNNVLGTLSAAQAAINAQVETFVLISTDKAVRPTNVMGATKRLAELVLQALAQNAAHQTRFTMVRFGNVLGSSGSVIPLFRKQIANGGPVTVTHPDIIRYFMTIPEAAELVIQAGALGRGGDVFVLDMGEPVKIRELARRMILLSGLSVLDEQSPEGDVAIQFTGLRPGEKLYEELLIGDNVSKTQHEKIMRAEESVMPWQQLEPVLNQLRELCQQGNPQAVKQVLLEHVDGFNPESV